MDHRRQGLAEHHTLVIETGPRPSVPADSLGVNPLNPEPAQRSFHSLWPTLKGLGLFAHTNRSRKYTHHRRIFHNLLAFVTLFTCCE